MKRIPRMLAWIAAATAAIFSGALLAQSVPPRLALNGYDPVAYFTQDRPVKGDPAFRHDFDESRYHFASADNRDRFARDPERYAPRYRGYCTGSMSRGVKNEGDPEIWAIVDDRLYLFGSGKGDEAGRAKGMGGRERLLKDPRAMTTLAERNWTAHK